MTNREAERSTRHEVASTSVAQKGQELPVTDVLSAETRKSKLRSLDAEQNSTTETGERSHCTPSEWYLRLR